jgi:hypothetical protein
MFSAMCRKVAGRLNTTEFAGSGLYRKRAPPELGDRQTILYLPITYFLYSLRKRKNNKYILPPPPLLLPPQCTSGAGLFDIRNTCAYIVV